jgi:hypothetical protein
MDGRKTFLLRLDARTYDQLRHWADDELRSVNAQIEFLLREALRKAGRLRGPDTGNGGPEPHSTSDSQQENR